VRRGPVTIAANLGTDAWNFQTGPKGKLLAASETGIEQTNRGLLLPPDTVAIVTEPQEP